MSKFKIGFVAAVILSVACSLKFFSMWRPVDYRMDEMPCDFDSKPRTYHHMRQKSCPTTFVTQYFQIPSKHSLSEYMEWIRNLHDADICLLVFTDSPHLWHGQRHAVIKTSLCSEGVALNRSELFWREQWYKDPEAFIHRGFYVYLAWNLKPYFLSEAVRMNTFSSQYFCKRIEADLCHRYIKKYGQSPPKHDRICDTEKYSYTEKYRSLVVEAVDAYFASDPENDETQD